jgi:thiol-disulfide isomerase/thioredoxin
MPGLPILDKIDDVNQFREYLHTNPGLIIIKFGADWCVPCKRIEKQVHDWFDLMPATVQGFTAGSTTQIRSLSTTGSYRTTSHASRRPKSD